MSKVGVAKSGGSVKEFIKQLFGSNEEASKQIDTLDIIKTTIRLIINNFFFI